MVKAAGAGDWAADGWWRVADPPNNGTGNFTDQVVTLQGKFAFVLLEKDAEVLQEAWQDVAAHAGIESALKEAFMTLQKDLPAERPLEIKNLHYAKGAKT